MRKGQEEMGGGGGCLDHPGLKEKGKLKERGRHWTKMLEAGWGQKLEHQEGRKGHDIMRKPPEMPVGFGTAGGVRHRKAGTPPKCAEQHSGEQPA